LVECTYCCKLPITVHFFNTVTHPPNSRVEAERCGGVKISKDLEKISRSKLLAPADNVKKKF